MEQKLTDFFPFHTSVDTRGKFISLTDQQSMSGQFIFNLMLEKYIKEKNVVHIISVCHKRHHYDAILRKLSHDLLKLEADNLIYIHFIKMPITCSVNEYDENIDASNLFISTTVGECVTSTPPSTTAGTSNADSSSPQTQAQAICQLITNMSLDQHTNRVVMIDDLIALDVILSSSTDSASCDCPYSALSLLYDFQTLLSLEKVRRR